MSSPGLFPDDVHKRLSGVSRPSLGWYMRWVGSLKAPVCAASYWGSWGNICFLSAHSLVRWILSSEKRWWQTLASFSVSALHTSELGNMDILIMWERSHWASHVFCFQPSLNAYSSLAGIFGWWQLQKSKGLFSHHHLTVVVTIDVPTLPILNWWDLQNHIDFAWFILVLSFTHHPLFFWHQVLTQEAFLFSAFLLNTISAGNYMCFFSVII